MENPSLSELYLRAKNTGIGALNIPWCGKRIKFNDKNYKYKSTQLDLKDKNLKKKNKQLKKYCIQLLNLINKKQLNLNDNDTKILVKIKKKIKY